jgi:hypothetical protein
MYGQFYLKEIPKDANHQKEHPIFMNFGMRDFTMKSIQKKQL